MMEFYVDSVAEEIKIRKALGALENQAPSVLAKALSMTAKEGRNLLAKEAQGTYVVKNVGFKKAMSVKNATKNNLQATIKSKGRPLELVRFKVNPATYKTGKERPANLRAKVLKVSTLKHLEKDGIKAFLIKFSSGHVTVAQRVGRKRYPIEVKYSPSTSKMLGNEKKVFGIVEPKMRAILDAQIEKQIAAVIRKGAGA